MTPEERAAQRQLVGIVRTGGAVVGDEGLEIWRERGCEEWKAGPEEISESLKLLGVQHTLAPAQRPEYRSKVHTPPLGTMVLVPTEALPQLATWVPALAKYLSERH